jgi:hypothetical protein
VKPQSERDAMGNTFGTMIGKLSVLIGELQKSGIQVNTSVTEITATARELGKTVDELNKLVIRELQCSVYVAVRSGMLRAIEFWRGPNPDISELRDGTDLWLRGYRAVESWTHGRSHASYRGGVVWRIKRRGVQATGAQQISEALAQLGEAVQQSVEACVNRTSGIEQLKDVSQPLKNKCGAIQV